MSEQDKTSTAEPSATPDVPAASGSPASGSTANGSTANGSPANGSTAAPKAAPQCRIEVTERAAKEVQRVIGEHGLDGAWVRIGAKGGGCSGLTYVLDFDQAGPTEFDITLEVHGIKLVIDKKSEFFMGGTVLDFNDGLLDRGFVFKNPQAETTCGCGTSFSV